MTNKEIIERTINSLKKNNFNVFYVSDAKEAHDLFFEKLTQEIHFKAFSWGDSMTMHQTKVIDELKKMPQYEYIDTFEQGLTFEEKYERRRQALITDLFITGTNAVTEAGQLVNLDMYGNRIGGINFGPRNVVIFVGTNKITKNLDEAMYRVRNVAAPKNGMRHSGFKTPCNTLGKCMDCSSPQRICNEWSIIEKCFPARRINIILIAQELGL